MRRLLMITSMGIVACGSTDQATDRRAVAIEGDWQLELRAEANAMLPPARGRMALVGVRSDARVASGDAKALAAGAISLDDGALERRIADGTRVTVLAAGADSVLFSFSSARGEYYVVMRGVPRGDTVSGVWQSVLARSSGSGGNFRMTRHR
jgi:hypothetical protein